MSERILTIKNKKILRHIHWLNVIGLGETMHVIVDAWEPQSTADAILSVLYKPNERSVWWKI